MLFSPSQVSNAQRRSAQASNNLYLVVAGEFGVYAGACVCACVNAHRRTCQTNPKLYYLVRAFVCTQNIYPLRDARGEIIRTHTRSHLPSAVTPHAIPIIKHPSSHYIIVCRSTFSHITRCACIFSRCRMQIFSRLLLHTYLGSLEPPGQLWFWSCRSAAFMLDFGWLKSNFVLHAV